MLKILDPKVEGMILALYEEKNTHRNIMSILKRRNVTVSNTLVHNINNKNGKRHQAMFVGLPSPVKRQPRKIATCDVIKKVNFETFKKNPMSKRDISRMVKVSQSTFNRITKSLNASLRIKTLFINTCLATRTNGKRRDKKLCERVLAGRNWEYGCHPGWIYDPTTQLQRKEEILLHQKR